MGTISEGENVAKINAHIEKQNKGQPNASAGMPSGPTALPVCS